MMNNFEAVVWLLVQKRWIRLLATILQNETIQSQETTSIAYLPLFISCDDFKWCKFSKSRVLHAHGIWYAAIYFLFFFSPPDSLILDSSSKQARKKFYDISAWRLGTFWKFLSRTPSGSLLNRDFSPFRCENLATPTVTHNFWNYNFIDGLYNRPPFPRPARSILYSISTIHVRVIVVALLSRAVCQNVDTNIRKQNRTHLQINKKCFIFT